MGCCTSQIKTENLSRPERLIQSSQKKLGFNELNSTTVDRAFSYFSNQKFISESQLISAFLNLKMEVTFFQDTTSDKFKFFQWFYKENYGYSLTCLSLVGIMLGKEDIQIKAVLLFQNYDRNCTGEIDSLTLNKMINEMMTVNLAIIDYSKKNFPNHIKILDLYSSNLKKSRNFLFNYVYLLMGCGRDHLAIKNTEFLISFKDINIRKIICANQFRHLAIEGYDVIERNFDNIK